MDPSVIVISLFVIALAAIMISRFGRSASMLEQWAAGQGYRLLHFERRKWRKGPFAFSTSRGQEVYQITVADREGKIKCGYIRCDRYFRRTYTDSAEVEWDSQLPRTPGPSRNDEPPFPPGFPVILKDRDRLK
jgi:hypothetical protein